MAKVVSDSFIDGGLVAYNGSTAIHGCTAEPPNAAGIAAISVATTTLTGIDFTLADGDTSGRKSTCGQQADVSVTTSGIITHVAVTDGTDFAATTCPATAVTAGGLVTFNAFDREIQDPT